MSTFRPFDRPVPKPRKTEPEDPVGAAEVGDRLGYERRSVHMMLRRGNLPEPDYESINGIRAWKWRTILWWAGETGRLRTGDALEQYQEMFDDHPPAQPWTRVVDGVTILADETPDIPKVPSR